MSTSINEWLELTKLAGDAGYTQCCKASELHVGDEVAWPPGPLTGGENWVFSTIKRCLGLNIGTSKFVMDVDGISIPFECSGETWVWIKPEAE